MLRLLSLYREAFSHLQRNIWILSVAMFINRSGSMVLLFTSLYMTKDLHFSIGEAGFIMSFYGMGSVLGSYIGGWLTDRMNYFHIMLFSLITCGFILLLMLVAISVWAIAAIIFAYSLTGDLFRPANSAAIAEYSSPENRTRSVSLVRLAVNLGFSIGPAIGGFVALYLGYKWLFVIDALTSILAALMLYFYLPRKRSHVRHPKNAVLNDRTTSAYRDGKYLLFILLVALYGTGFFQLFASMPQYFSTVCNYNEDTIGLLLALNGLLVVLIEMPLISYLEKSRKIFSFIVAGTLFLSIAFLVLFFGKGMMAFAILYTLIITMSEVFAMPFMMNFALSRPLKERQGQYSALYSMAYGISTIIAPSIGLGIADRFGFNSLFVFLISLSLLVAAGFAFLGKNEKAAKKIVST